MTRLRQSLVAGLCGAALFWIGVVLVCVTGSLAGWCLVAIGLTVCVVAMPPYGSERYFQHELTPADPPAEGEPEKSAEGPQAPFLWLPVQMTEWQRAEIIAAALAVHPSNIGIEQFAGGNAKFIIFERKQL